LNRAYGITLLTALLLFFSASSGLIPLSPRWPQSGLEASASVNDNKWFKTILNLREQGFFVPRLKASEDSTAIFAIHLLLDESENSEHSHRLSHKDKIVEIYWKTDVAQPHHVRYKMLGVDDNWINTTDSVIRYRFLPPRVYQLQVQGMLENEIPVGPMQRLHLTIDAPYWQTWWFLCAVFLSVVSFLWSTFYFRLLLLKRQNVLMKTAFESEQKALRAQMTPHFIFNSLNSIQQLIANNDTREAVKNMSTFARLMRRILENSKSTVIPLAEELQTLRLYLELESLRFGDRFIYEIIIDPDLDLEAAEIPPMLIQPYVENAIWHGIMNKEKQQGRVEIKIVERNDQLICCITDDGVGRKNAGRIQGKHHQHESSGMKITKERLKILNATHNSNMSLHVVDLEDAEGNATGTKIEIFIPLNS